MNTLRKIPVGRVFPLQDEAGLPHLIGATSLCDHEN